MTYVKNYTYKDISSVHEKSTLRRVIQIMCLHRINAVPVVNKKGEYLGCISEHDILSFAIPGYMKIMKNTSFMADLNHTMKHLNLMVRRYVFSPICSIRPCWLSITASCAPAKGSPSRQTRTSKPRSDGTASFHSHSQLVSP